DSSAMRAITSLTSSARVTVNHHQTLPAVSVLAARRSMQSPAAIADFGEPLGLPPKETAPSCGYEHPSAGALPTPPQFHLAPHPVRHVRYLRRPVQCPARPARPP